jgi:hypothetical protein
MRVQSFESALDHIKLILNKFRDDVRNTYDENDCKHGYIIAKDRNGKECSFELLSASAVVVAVQRKSRHRAIDLVHKHFASQKKVAKTCVEHINVSTLL